MKSEEKPSELFVRNAQSALIEKDFHLKILSDRACTLAAERDQWRALSEANAARIAELERMVEILRPPKPTVSEE
ncbi:MAG TPA: hypothetical protein VIM56_03745 [Rhizomicrobium sp.]